MANQFPRLDPDYLKRLAERDPIRLELEIRALRHAHLRRMLAVPLRFVWRLVRHSVGGFAQSASGGTDPFPSRAKVLIANLMGLR